LNTQQYEETRSSKIHISGPAERQYRGKGIDPGLMI
jgi:hypothetical protein